MKKIVVVFVLVLVVLFVAVSPARAAGPNYCFPSYDPQRCWGLMQVLENLGQRGLAGMAIGLMKGFAEIAWLVDRAAVFIFSKSVPDNGWLLTIKDQMLNLFAGIMPDLLRQVSFGGQGLMYVALSLAGLAMIVPLWGMGARFVRAERVMVWGVLLSFLFVGGAFGYDFIGAVEGFRQGLVNQVAQGGTAMPLDSLVLQPMLAGDGDLGFGGDLLALPMIFDSTYFPSPQLTEVTISEGGGFGFGNANVELPEAIQRRIVAAGQGVFYAFVSLVGAALLIVVGVTYIILAFAALLLILFLFAALPLGFFEFGSVLLGGILERYLQLTVQSLALAIFLRWLSSGLGFVVAVNSVPNALTWIVLLVVMIIIAGTFFNGAVRIMLGSGSVFRTVGQQFGGPSVLQRTVSTAAGGVAAAAGVVSAGALLMGRPEVALAAGALGSGARRLAQPGGERAYDLSEGEAAENRRGNVFVANGGGGLGDLAMLAGAASMMGRGAAAAPRAAQPQETASAQGSGAVSAPPQGTGAAVSAPPQGTGAAVSAPPIRPEPLAEWQIIAARNGWDDAQRRQVEQAAASAPTAQAAVAQIQKAPGFERASSEELLRAVEAARAMRVRK
jgi:hypothetical protein